MPDYTWAEMMAVSIAHEMSDGEFGSIGAASHIPAAGLRLAQLTHAPDLTFFCGGSGAIARPVTGAEIGSCGRNGTDGEARSGERESSGFEQVLHGPNSFDSV